MIYRYPCSILIYTPERPRINITRRTDHGPHPRLADYARPVLAREEWSTGQVAYDLG